MEERLRRVLEPLDRARSLPRAAYVEERFFALDRALFRSSWLPVAHASELGAPGAFATADAGGERVVVARGADLELSGFLDGCLHRATPLFEQERGRLPKLFVKCPYHGLTYDLRGVADAARCASLGLEPGARLRPARVAERFGFVFACVDARAPDFDAWAGASPPPLARASTHALRLGRRVSHEVAANWKLLVENFQESHHFTLVHPSLEARTPWRDSTSVDFGGAFLGGTMDLEDEAETVSDVPGREGRPLIAAAEDARTVHDALLVPGWLTSLQPDYFLSYRIVPLAPARTRVLSEIYFHAGAFEATFDPKHVYAFWDRTNAEDRAICERQQRGLAFPGIEMGGYAPVEDGVHALDRRLAAYYLSALGDA